MSVFTEIGEAELSRWLEACGAGRLREFAGLPGGVENSNYRVVTDRGEWVLTLFEWQPAGAASERLALVAHLADRGLPVARPQPQPGGDWVGELAGKPAALQAWLPGRHVSRPRSGHCAAVGGFIAGMHEEAAGFAGRLADTRGADWRADCREALEDRLDRRTLRLLDEATTDASALPALPEGVIHADLFRDNALFDGARLTGVIDFQYACRAPFAYDVAVAAIDWCAGKHGLDRRRLSALCGGYDAVRTVDTLERIQFPRLLALAALRFWLSRTYDAHFPRAGPDVERKDPRPMYRMLKHLREQPVAWP